MGLEPLKGFRPLNTHHCVAGSMRHVYEFHGYPIRLGAAVWYSLLLWVLGFVWGVVVFIVPSLKAVQSISYVSKYPAISFVLLPVYIVLVYLVARHYLRSRKEKATEGLKLGIVIMVVTIVLDALVYVVLLGGGDYFTFLSVWISYAMFVLVPWLVGRRLQTNRPI